MLHPNTHQNNAKISYQPVIPILRYEEKRVVENLSTHFKVC